MFPKVSCATTWTAGDKATVAAPFGGCTWNASFFGAPATPVAVAVVVTLGAATSFAVSDCVPSVVPSVQVTDTSPFALVVSVALSTEPPPATASVTGTPATPRLSAAFTRTTTG